MRKRWETLQPIKMPITNSSFWKVPSQATVPNLIVSLFSTSDWSYFFIWKFYIAGRGEKFESRYHRKKKRKGTADSKAKGQDQIATVRRLSALLSKLNIWPSALHCTWTLKLGMWDTCECFEHSIFYQKHLILLKALIFNSLFTFELLMHNLYEMTSPAAVVKSTGKFQVWVAALTVSKSQPLLVCKTGWWGKHLPHGLLSILWEIFANCSMSARCFYLDTSLEI